MSGKHDYFPRELCLLLHQLGISATYRGFYQTAYAVMLAMEDMDRLLLVTKLLYQDTAKQYHTSVQGVERNIHTVAQVAWKHNRPMLEQLAHAPLPAPPSPSQLIAMLASHLLAEEDSPSL